MTDPNPVYVDPALAADLLIAAEAIASQLELAPEGLLISSLFAWADTGVAPDELDAKLAALMTKADALKAAAAGASDAAIGPDASVFLADELDLGCDVLGELAAHIATWRAQSFYAEETHGIAAFAGRTFARVAEFLRDGEGERVRSVARLCELNDAERYCPCGRSTATHHRVECERRWAADERARIETHGLCPAHDLGLPFSCTCPPFHRPADAP